MTQKTAATSKAPTTPEATRQPATKLPSRDWFILPLLSLLTLVILLASVEGVACHLYQESKTSTISCLVLDDPHAAVHAKPNTVCTQKIYESELTEFRFNGCGHRTSLPCAPPPPGTFRIVLAGSSLAEGLWVPVQKTFASELPGRLSEITGRRIDLYNEAMQWGTPRSVDLRMNEIFAVKPNLVLWTVDPWDIEKAKERLPYIPGKQEADDGEPPAPVPSPNQSAAPTTRWQAISASYHHYPSLSAFLMAKWQRTVEPLNETRTVFMLQHLLYKSQNQFLKNYVNGGDGAGFLQTTTPPAWQKRLTAFDEYMADISSQLKAQGIPLVVVLMPHRSQADMISLGEWPPNVDPYKIGNDVKQIAEKHGATYINILPDFRTIPNPDQFFFPVDGHMTAEGHTILTNILAKELTSGVVPALRPRPTTSATPGAH